MPLKRIPSIINPDLLHALALMGHGDEILLADRHFPAASIAASSKTKPILIRADGHGIPELLKAILQLIELDSYVSTPVTLMERVHADAKKEIPIWKIYREILKGHVAPAQYEQYFVSNVDYVEYVERFEFYEKSKKVFVIVQTGESAQYGNIILTNGVVL